MQIPCTDREFFILKKIATAAEASAMPAYIIGGFVRDKILGRNTKDADIVVLGDGIAFAEKIAERFHPKPAVTIFKNFGTAQIKLPDIEIEVVGARKESYRSESRKPQVEQGSLQDDQNRRDFTINALSVSLNKKDFGELIDPFNGIKDLQKRIIRTPLKPEETFSDDPLRMMRAIRFAAQLNFTIEEKTFEAIVAEKERINIISKERIADELNKIMLSKKPSIGWDLLFRSGLLQIIFPQMAALAGAENVEGIGHKDNFYHTIQVIDNISVHTDNLWLRWAALLHDIGKPPTKKFEKGHGWTFHGHEIVGAKMVSKIFAQLKLPLNEKMKYVRKLVALHMRPAFLSKDEITDSAIRRLLFDAGEDADDLMTLCEADITSKNPNKVRRYLQNFEIVRQRMIEVEENDKLRNWQPPVTGQLIMETFNLQPSREVGIIKDFIRESILDGIIPNNYEDAYQLMLKKANELGLKAVDKN
ncbi:MAG: HD domain-containing protein [Arachidicoccus sp.]|nr:HD domain-containing protein [Arachidicoccus sp.]